MNWKTLLVATLMSVGIFMVREHVLRIEGFQDTIGWSLFSLVYYMTLSAFFFILLMMVCQPKYERWMRGMSLIGLVSYEVYLVHGYTYEYLKNSDFLRVAVFFMTTFALSHLYQIGFKKIKTIIKI